MKKRKKRKGINGGTPRCPYCGSNSVLRSADGIYYDNSRDVMLYVCKNYPKCDSYVRVHPGTNIPMGSLANKELRAMRRDAHHHFNKLYSKGGMSKRDAYEWLAETVGLPVEKAYIGFMGEYYCSLVIEESKKALSQLSMRKNNRLREMYEAHSGSAKDRRKKHGAGREGH